MKKLNQQVWKGGLLLLSIIVGLIILLPLIWMLLTSFKTGSEIIKYPPSMFPNALSFENYCNLFMNTKFLLYLKNSFIVATSVVVICGTISTLGAYSLSRQRFRGDRYFIFSSLFGYMVAPIMIVIPFFMIMKLLGLANTLTSLIIAHTAFCFPFSIWMMYAYFKDLPLEYEKSALIDGASRSQALLHVVLPNVFPGLIAVGIFIFILSWNDYVFARILITGEKAKTIPVGIEEIYSSSVVDWGMLMAAGVVISIPVLLGFILIYKFFIKKMAYSGVKN